MLKKADGAVTQHATKKQFGSGGGVTNVPLKKSTVNPTQPNVYEGKSHKASAPKSPPTAAEKKGKPAGTVAVNEAKAGGGSGRNTFTAPRREGGHDPLECGYTRPGKM